MYLILLLLLWAGWLIAGLYYELQIRRKKKTIPDAEFSNKQVITNLSNLKFIAEWSPTVGLLGTMYGMYTIFFGGVATQSVNAFGVGVAQALLTTIFGGCVALIAALAHNIFQNKGVLRDAKRNLH